MINLYSWVEGSSTVCVAALPTLSSKRNQAFELEAGRKCCLLKVWLESLKSQRNKVSICVFPPFSEQLSILLSWDVLLQHLAVHDEQRAEPWTGAATIRDRSWGVTWPSCASPSLTFLCSSGRGTKHALGHPTVLWPALILDRWGTPIDLCCKLWCLPKSYPSCFLNNRTVILPGWQSPWGMNQNQSNQCDKIVLMVLFFHYSLTHALCDRSFQHFSL